MCEGGLIVVYTLIASGATPTISTLASKDMRSFFLDRLYALYGLSERRRELLRNIVASYEPALPAEQMLLPDSITVSTLTVGKTGWFKRPGRLQVILGPRHESPASGLAHFAALRVVGWHKEIAEVLAVLERAILSDEGRLLLRG
jgi:hypothetical protein